MVKNEKTTSYWKKKLWPWFSKYIKQRDGYVCFTCGRKCQGQGAQAGHLFPKAACNLDAYFSETNTHCQCFKCNINLGGNGAVYRDLAEKKYGKDVIRHLDFSRKKPVKWSEEDFKKKIEYYKKLSPTLTC